MRGLGYVLSHDRDQNEIVWIGSRVLTPAGSSYAVIEREALAIVEAVKHLHQFMAGRCLTILSDHRPLQYIFNPKPQYLNMSLLDFRGRPLPQSSATTP